MERSGSQKALKVISILIIIGAALGLLAAVGFAGVGGVIAGTTDEVVVDGMSNTDVGGMLGLASIVALISSIISLVQGILGIRASNDITKINPVWILAIIGIVFAVISLIMAITDASDLMSPIISVVFSGIYFWIANNIKKQNEAVA